MMSEGMIDKFYYWIEDWNGNEVIIINRLFTDAVLFMNKIDKEIFNKAVQGYVKGSKKNIPNLMQYAKELRLQK